MKGPRAVGGMPVNGTLSYELEGPVVVCEHPGEGARRLTLAEASGLVSCPTVRWQDSKGLVFLKANRVVEPKVSALSTSETAQVQ